MHLYLQKYISVSSELHLSVEDGLQCTSIRELPQKRESYHQRLLREERRSFATLPIEPKSLCSSISKTHGIRRRKHKVVQSCVRANLIPSSLSDQPAGGKEEEGVAR